MPPSRSRSSLKSLAAGLGLSLVFRRTRELANDEGQNRF